MENKLPRLIYLALCVVLFSGCTTTPDKYKRQSGKFGQSVVGSLPGLSLKDQMPLKADNSKMQAVATARVGESLQYVEPGTGVTVMVTVDSEYFSANGRNCRRFTEMHNGRSHKGVGCEDERNGWVELPLAAYLN